MTARSTNSEDFRDFMQILQANIRPGSRPYLVHDNHKAHWAIMSRPIIERNFIRLPLPAYSCQFNSIERLWSNIKHRFRYSMAAESLSVSSRDHLVNLVMRTAVATEPEVIEKMITSNRAYLLRVLHALDQGVGLRVVLQ
jgi:transposase